MRQDRVVLGINLRLFRVAAMRFRRGRLAQILPLTTTPLELTLARASSTDSKIQYGHHLVESSAQRLAWQSCRIGRCLAGVGLASNLGSLSRCRSCRRISDLAGAHDRIGLGLGDPVARLGEPCLAHRHNDSGPFDHDRTDGRTIGHDALSRSDWARLGGLLDHVFLWVLQASPSTYRRLTNQCNRDPSTDITIKTPP
jgi:hypothetical protein